MNIRFTDFAYFPIALSAALVLIGAPDLAAEERLYQQDTLIVPMDTTYQDFGMLEAYGLLYQLLLQEVPVDWVIGPGKDYGGIDFRASARDVQSGLPVDDHGYRGGPFVIDSPYSAAALPIVQAWQIDHPLVSVHLATQAFTADSDRRLVVAPNIAVFADGKEDVAFGYLNAAAIPMSNGDSWPSKNDKDREYACPGPKCCPDCLDETEAAGPTTASHTDGALFDANGAPRYCQFMSMHYKHPAPTPEVVAEVREFLQHPVHFLAECQAVNAFENAPAGNFLTAGGLVAGNESSDVDHYENHDPFAQADGDYANPGGSEPAFSLETGSYYHSSNVVMLSTQGTALGVDDIWMNGHLDGDPSKGKVSYLGGHKYGVNTPISTNPGTQGTRYFLNSLFEAPCSSEQGQPSPSTWIDGAGATNGSDYTLTVCHDNAGPGIAFNSVLTLSLPVGATFVSATGDGQSSGDSVSWDLGSVTADTSSCQDVTVSFASEGAYGFSSTLDYDAGLVRQQIDSGPPSIVRYGEVNLLRFDGVTATSPRSPDIQDIFVAEHPVDPALDSARDLEVTAFVSGLPFPHDVSDLLPGSPPLVFYELDGDRGNTLRVNRAAGKIVIAF
jgi:hypothetical protein